MTIEVFVSLHGPIILGGGPHHTRVLYGTLTIEIEDPATLLDLMEACTKKLIHIPQVGKTLEIKSFCKDKKQVQCFGRCKWDERTMWIEAGFIIDPKGYATYGLEVPE